MIIKHALISVFDKNKIIELAKILTKCNIKIFSTGGTSKILKKSGIDYMDISQYTNVPEMINGRIKTLHHKIYAGILAREGIDDKDLNKQGIIKIDMVVVNFYPFLNIVQMKKNSLNSILEYIDIGGPAIVRAAAKNYENVVVLVNKNDYQPIAQEILKNNNSLSINKRLQLATTAFNYVTEYDNNISDYFLEINKNKLNKNLNNNIFPKYLNIKFVKKYDLCYGENKHQKSAFYVNKNILDKITYNTTQLQGKLLSYNNKLDSNVAVTCIQEFYKPVCVIVKHGNPCSVAVGKDILSSYLNAYNSDPISSFGGVIAFNKELNEELAKTIIKKQFTEIIIAPSVNKEFLNIIKFKPKIKILIYKNLDYVKNNLELRSISEGLLVQEPNYNIEEQTSWNIVTKRKPNLNELKDSLFAWKVVKHVKSNAIVYVKNLITIGIGAGQMSRIYAAKLAKIKAEDLDFDTKKSVMASDAFFPFRDGIDMAASIGITCIIQPGGSIRDSEVINAANEHNIAMIFTNIRCFKH
ncbi:bifunctional phosphoribosylaminoimidazolecarboxamide formyltransferase/IMP cyclohydrolase [Buchnera aphidicola (Formosaphis micheliae)]|uniref:bifunctional phosphoribosylaminoimidazolecarboxamide formyltransferase/IMP cyclohydrolase n=1 Tax=Buchnera aphidicola TaxID=9 RepID=UPI0031B7FDF5